MWYIQHNTKLRVSWIDLLMRHAQIAIAWLFMRLRMPAQTHSMQPTRRRLTIVTAGLLVGVLLSACSPVTLTAPTANYSSEVAVAWYDVTMDLIRTTPGYSPPVASRALGYMGVTLYETVRPGMPGYRSLAGQLNELDTLPTADPTAHYHWPTAANSALATVIRALFPTAPAEQLAAVDALQVRFDDQFLAEVDAETLRRSQAWGETVAQAILAWAETDGGHEGYMTNVDKSYVPPTGAGLWVKTPPGFADALQPHWGDNRPFVLRDGNACPAPAPPAYSVEVSSDFYWEAEEVYQTVRRQDPEQIAIAHFWADDAGRTATPPGHWVSILSQVLVQEEAGLDVAAESYAKVGMVVADAFITCWHTKYIYNLVRPISYIQTVIDPAWNAETMTDPVTTPPFPEYTSGHSVQSAAAARVLSDLFGEAYAFTDHTHDDLGYAPRSYGSFVEAAEEAAISRLYGGIHYRSAIEQGLRQGECVADHILSLAFTK